MSGRPAVVIVVVITVVSSRCDTAALPPLPHTRRSCADDRMCQGRSTPWCRGRCSCRCSTNRTCSRSPTRTIPASGWCAVHNPALADDRARERQELLAATEQDLATVAAATRRDTRPLRGRDKIALRVGKVMNKFKVAKHFHIEITDNAFTFFRDEEKIAAEAALDGIYVLRTSLPAQTLHRDDVVLRYQGLEDVRAVLPHPQHRTRRAAHPPPPRRPGPRPRVPTDAVLLPELADEAGPGAILFYDNDKPAAAAKRHDPVAPAQRSHTALAKAAPKRTPDDYPVHSFTSLLAALATICANQIQPTTDLPAFTPMITTPTPLQQRAFELLGVSHRHRLA